MTAHADYTSLNSSENKLVKGFSKLKWKLMRINLYSIKALPGKLYILRKYTPLLFGLCLGMMFSVLTVRLEKSDGKSGYSNFNQPVDIGDIEPKWNIDSDPKPVKLKKITRPRFMSTELGIRKKLLVGVISNLTDIQTNGVALLKILNPFSDKLLFFVQGKPNEKLKQLVASVVGFTDTRELLLPFYVMKYIHEHLDKFDYVYLITSNTYLHTHALSSFLDNVNAGDHLYVGQPFHDDVSKHICRLESGILLSQSIIQSVVQKLDWCARNAYADNHGMNLGRCIMHATNIPCMQEVHQHKYRALVFDGESLAPLNLKVITRMQGFNETIAIFPVTKPQMMYEIHRLYLLRKMDKLTEAISTTRQKIVEQVEKCPLKLNPDSWPIGISEPYKPSNRFTVITWEFFDDNNLYLHTELENLRRLDGIDKIDIENVLDHVKIFIATNSNNTLMFKKLLNGYRRYDPTRGMEYICDVLVSNITSHENMYKRYMAIRPICKVEMVPMPYVTENKRIVLLLPINASVDSRLSASYFIHRYAHTCLESQDNTVLVLVYQYESHQSKIKGELFRNIQSLVQEYLKKYKDNSRIMSLTMETSPATTILTVLNNVIKTRKFPSESLILLCSSYMEMDPDFLNRVRMNTILHKQVYNPIPFLEFHPDIIYNGGEIPEKLEINKNNGHFLLPNELFMSFYIDDFKAAKKFAENKNQGNNLLETFLMFKELHVLQGIEPSLRLRYVHEDCNVNSSVFVECVDRVSSRLGSRFQLGQLLLQYENEGGAM